ncbi:helix-turn-helix transcriptional regulator [Stackebrandtia soli]|uniref:helix-turn-helix transcriptional regulator n=1 Tax=Stackebrandtia soli TaxID=1892856 RepID=UPI0039E9F176
MLPTHARLLRLLSLLQTPREWAGPELAARLDVTPRTIRRDVDRLRELGYPVDATQGVHGGYRLRAGTKVPPLLLDDDEAVAIAVGLRLAARSRITGIDDAAELARAKLDGVLPSRLRQRVAALHTAVTAMPEPTTDNTMDPSVLDAVSTSIRVRETLRFDYVDHHGTPSRRSVEPHQAVLWDRRWYLVGFDVDRDDWRTFRLDRVRPLVPGGPRFTPREAPGGDLVAYLRNALGFDMWPYRCRVRVAAPAADVAALVSGIVTPIDATTCELELATDSYDLAAMTLAWLGADFTVEAPPGLRRAVDALANRLRRAAEG